VRKACVAAWKRGAGGMVEEKDVGHLAVVLLSEMTRLTLSSRPREDSLLAGLWTAGETSSRSSAELTSTRLSGDSRRCWGAVVASRSRRETESKQFWHIVFWRRNERLSWPNKNCQLVGAEKAVTRVDLQCRPGHTFASLWSTGVRRLAQGGCLRSIRAEAVPTQLFLRPRND
jgi:hypothetical protein